MLSLAVDSTIRICWYLLTYNLSNYTICSVQITIHNYIYHKFSFKRNQNGRGMTTDMIPLRNQFDKRLLMRYPAIDGVVVAVRPHTEILGYMIDISLGGLSFRYIDTSLANESSSELTILVTEPRLCLDRIPFRTVADFELPVEFSFSSIRTRRRCVEFGQMTLQQRYAIEDLVRRCSFLDTKFYVNSTPDAKVCVRSQNL